MFCCHTLSLTSNDGTYEGSVSWAIDESQLQLLPIGLIQDEGAEAQVECDATFHGLRALIKGRRAGDGAQCPGQSGFAAVHMAQKSNIEISCHCLQIWRAHTRHNRHAVSYTIDKFLITNKDDRWRLQSNS